MPKTLAMSPEGSGQARMGLRERFGSGIGVIAVLAATLCWASAGVIAVKADVRGLPLTFWRVLLVAGCFGGLMLIRGERLSVAVLRQATPAGLLFAGSAAMFFEAVRHTSVGIATIVAALTPVLAMPIAVRWLGERPTATGVACALGATLGVAMFVAPGYRAADTRPVGLLLSGGSMLCWVVYLFATKRARSGIGTVQYMTAMNLSAALVLLPLTLVVDAGSLMVPARSWPWIGLLAILPGFLGHGLLTWAQPMVALSVSSILLQGEPVGAALAGAVFLGEPINAVQAAGIAVAVASLSILARSTVDST
ncbi:MAG: DMT family transporter [Acidimicrobiia bacterium]|nr:DMT family transporter [Acidimicrobiia bacterium]